MPKVFGKRWEVQSQLAETGQAWTYLVRDLKGEYAEQCVLKRLKNPDRINRFANELRAMTMLQHRNVAAVLDADLDADEPYLVMPYYAGGNLADARPFSDRSVGELMDLFGQVCDGVAAAHENVPQVLHRDVKPENVFLFGDRKGDAVVGDFGLCLLADEDRVTETIEVIGSRFYTAPELEDGRLEDCTSRSDVYSLGKVFYWLLSSGKMFNREKHREPAFDLVNVVGNPHLEHVNRLLDQAIAARPEDRFTNVNELRAQVTLVKDLVVRERYPVTGPFNPINHSFRAVCSFCGRGTYVTSDAVRQNFLKAGWPGKWRYLVCNYCGHVHTFRPDLAQLAANSPCGEPHLHYACAYCAANLVSVDDDLCERCGRSNQSSD